MHFYKMLLSVLSLGLVITACKDPVETKSPEVPSSYNFSNVSFSGQTARLDMFEELSAYTKTANNAGVVLDAQLMKDMFANRNMPFADSSLNNTTKQIKNKCFETEIALFEMWMDSLASVSQSLVPGTPGVSGVVVSTTNPDKKYLLSANGYDIAQLIQKGLMGALCYYQATGVYLSGEKMNVENETVVEGKGTAMQHHWDEAFGYLGATVDFPVSTENLRFSAKYCNEMNAMLQTNKLLGEAFLKGRFAIDQKNMADRDMAISEVRTNWELVFAATAIHYMNEAKANAADVALRSHALSEGYGFIYSLQFNPERSYTLTEIEEMLTLFGDDLYTISLTDIDAIKAILVNGIQMDQATADAL